MFRKITLLERFHPDIIFYQQPWQLNEKTQSVLTTSKYALNCYTPYCFRMFGAEREYANYIENFHGFMWQYFVENQSYADDYIAQNDAQNCKTVGSTKLDNYLLVDNSNENRFWKKQSQKRVIYAPHHSFHGALSMATFKENGALLLSLAQKYPGISWVFKPHPRLKRTLAHEHIMSEQEVMQYYQSWEDIGKIYDQGEYYDLFASSVLLITDCISFLAEYLPSKKPVIFLKSSLHKEKEFSKVGQQIVRHYYHIHNNQELEAIFHELTLENHDPLENERTKNATYLTPGDISVSEKIIDILASNIFPKT